MIVDLFLVYQFIRRLATPFNKWDAYKSGVIDEKGKVLIKSKDRDSNQKKSWSRFDILVANLKKLLAKVPGGSSRLASYAAALFLIKEHKAFTDESTINEDMTDEQLEESLLLFNELYSYYINEAQNVNSLNEEGAFKRIAQTQSSKTDRMSSTDKKGLETYKKKESKVDVKPELEEAKAQIKWKKAGPNGEIETTVKGVRYKIEKALDSNERHKGEYKVMIWDKRSEDWEWDTTEYGKVNAKARVFFHLKENSELDEEPANNVGGGNIAGMDGGHMSKAGQKKWTSQNKSKKKKLRDMIGDKVL